MPAGRPSKFATPEELQAKIDAYFDSLANPNGGPGRPVTITGLALALDTTRETLCNYAEKDEFSDTIARAKLRVENYAEEQLFIGRNPHGAQFALKNYGWKDSQDHNIGGQRNNPVETKHTHTIDMEAMAILGRFVDKQRRLTDASA